MSELVRLPQKPLQYDCASCGDSLATGHRQRMREVSTCPACGVVCALDDSAAGGGTPGAVKVVPTGTAAIVRPT